MLLLPRCGGNTIVTAATNADKNLETFPCFSCQRIVSPSTRLKNYSYPQGFIVCHMASYDCSCGLKGIVQCLLRLCPLRHDYTGELTENQRERITLELY